MSRSNPNENLVNPAKFFYEWDGGDGGFKYFDKSLGEKGEKVKQELPFTFIPLDVLVTIKGFNESEQKGYWSNEIRQFDIKTGILTVRSKAGVEMIGTYEQVKAKLGTKGADYCQSVYCATKGADGKLVLNNIQIKGAALGAWIKFVKKNNINEVAVAVKDMVKKKKGRVDYVEPVFSAVKIKEETNQEAIELDKLLQEYLKTYLAKNASSPTAEEPKQEQQKAEPSKPAAAASAAVVDNIPSDIISDMEDDNLPF